MELNLLLLRRSFRSGWKRMALIASSVAIGVLILLCFTAVFNALTDMTHVAWLNNLSNTESSSREPLDGIDPTYVIFAGSDTLNNKSVQLIDMQKSGPNTAEIAPGLAVPNPGEFYASPALAEYIDKHPDEHLNYRYGRLIGELPESIVPGRDDYYIVRGADYPIIDGRIYLHFDEYYDGQGTPVETFAIYQFSDYEVDSYFDSAEYNISKAVVYAGIIILLFPVIMLVSIATRLGSVQREQRYAALRLIGVTNGQVIGIIATESFISTVIGILAGWLIYLVVHPLLYNFTLSESRFWPSQITVTTTQTIIIAILTISMSLFANWWGMRHVRTSPLGISQKQRVEKKPGWWRIVPLGISLAILIYLTVHKPQDNDETLFMINFFLILIVAMMFSLVIVTPWLTYHLANLVSKLTKRPTILIGAKYIHAHSRAISRSVSGVVLALFAGSFYLLGTSGVSSLEARSIANNGYSALKPDTAAIQGLTNETNAQIIGQLKTTGDNLTMVKDYLPTNMIGDYAIGQCLAMNQYLVGLDCGQGDLVGVNFQLATNDADWAVYANDVNELTDRIIANTMDIFATTEEIAKNYVNDDRPSYQILVAVSNQDIEKLRSVVAGLTGDLVNVISASEAKTPSINPAISNLASLAYAGMGATMAIAIVSIVVSTIGGLLERRRSMYMLRLSGMQTSELKRMVLIESLIPLVIMSFVSAGIGAWAGMAFIALGSSTLTTNVSPGYIAIIGGSLLLATLAIWLILPMINRLTSPEANQTE